MGSFYEEEKLNAAISDMAELSSLITGTENEEEFFKKLLDVALKSIPQAECATIWKIEGTLYRPVAGFPYEQDILSKMVISYEDSYAYNHNIDECIVQTNNILDYYSGKNERFYDLLSSIKTGRNRMCTIIAPLKVNSKIAGHIFIDNFSLDSFEDVAKRALKIFSNFASTFLTLKTLKDSETEANELNRVYLSFITHELKTPLTSIIGFSETILDESNMKLNAMRGYIRKIYASSRHLNSLIDDLSTFNKLNRETTLNIRKINFKQALFEAVSIVEPNISPDVELDISYSSDIPSFIETDPTKFTQVLVNIIGNAIKYTDEGSIFVHSSFDSSTKEFVISVRDTGIGISKEKLEDIFKPFYRVSKNRPGSGLGLAIVKKTLQALKGRISVSSEEGKGSEFLIRLPQIIKTDEQ
jgi:signal transduction histidine kinase